MVVLKVLLGVVGFLLLLLLLPARVRIRYDRELVVWGGLGPVRLRVFPLKKKKKGKKPQKKRVKKKKPQKPKSEQQREDNRLTLEKLREYLEFGNRTLKRLKRLMRVRFFKLHVVLGGDNPMGVALAYGGAAAVISAIYPILEHGFRVRSTDIFVDADFEGQGSLLLDTEIRTTPLIVLIAGIKILLAFFQLKNKAQQESMNIREAQHE